MREHFEHLLAAFGALGLALFISYFSTGPLVKLPPSANVSGSLTPLPSEKAPAFSTTTLPSFDFSTSTLENILPKPVAPPAEPVQPVTPKTPVPAPEATPTPAAPSPKPRPAPAPEPTPPPVDEFGRLRGSIVNILCISHVPPVRSTSGSGILIDSDGVILTVAHVAQSFVLEEFLGKDKISCTIRTGDPARDAYTARPIYVSAAWIHANPTTLISSQPVGTGENDYALLAITGSAGKPLPGAFPAVSVSNTPAHIGDAVLIGSYGAQGLTSAQVRTALSPILVRSTVKNRYTFTSATQDVLGIAGSQASQEGSSGGAVVNESSEVVGLITTSQTTGDFATREMRVLTPSYIRRSFLADTGKDFDRYFTDTSLTTLVNVYAPSVAKLGEYLVNAMGITQ